MPGQNEAEISALHTRQNISLTIGMTVVNTDMQLCGGGYLYLPLINLCG